MIFFAAGGMKFSLSLLSFLSRHVVCLSSVFSGGYGFFFACTLDGGFSFFVAMVSGWEGAGEQWGVEGVGWE